MVINLPEVSKKRPQQPSGGPFPGDSPRYEPQKTSDPQVAFADAKTQIQVNSCGTQHKQTVAEAGVPGPQRPEEAVHDPQSSAQQEAERKTTGGNFRDRHPISRRSQPPAFGSS